MQARQTNLLCIDDDVQSLEVRKILFEINGYRVLTARGGADGLRLFRSQPVDAVILDYQMPEMDGGEVATRMKDLRPQVPILMLSAVPELPDKAHGHVDGFICKGEPTAKLVKSIEQLLAERDSSEASRPPRFARLGIMTGVVVGKLSSLVARPQKRPRFPKAKAPAHFQA